MLTTDKTVFLLVDVQGKLAHSMHAKENLFKNLKKIVKGMRVLEVPILWAEQNPKGLTDCSGNCRTITRCAGIA